MSLTRIVRLLGRCDADRCHMLVVSKLSVAGGLRLRGRTASTRGASRWLLFCFSPDKDSARGWQFFRKASAISRAAGHGPAVASPSSFSAILGPTVTAFRAGRPWNSPPPKRCAIRLAAFRAERSHMQPLQMQPGSTNRAPADVAFRHHWRSSPSS